MVHCYSTDEIINRFAIGYVIKPSLNCNKVFRVQVEKWLSLSFASRKMENIRYFLKNKNTCVMELIMIYDNNGGNAKQVYRVLSCLLYHRKLCLYWLSFVSIKNLKIHFIQTNIWRNKFQYITWYWNFRTVTEPSILSWFHEETKFKCDIKFPILFSKSILHYWKCLKAVTFPSKLCEIDN